MGAFDDLIPASQSANPGAFDDLIPAKTTGGLAAAAKQAIGSTIKGVGQAATDFLPGVTAANPVSAYGQSVIDANPTATNSLGDIVESPWTATKEAVGNAAGSMGSMLGARALGTGITMAAPFTGPAAPVVAGAGQLIANVGPFVAAALPSYGGIRESQIQADPANEADGKSKAIALLGAGTVGAIEGAFGPQAWALAAMKKGGIESIAKRFADAKSLPGAIGKGILKGGAIEGSEEIPQNVIEQVAGYRDPTTRQAIGETLLGGAMGAIGGGVLSGGMAGMAYRPKGPIEQAADTGEITGANEQKRQEQAIAAAAAPTTGTTNASNVNAGNDAAASAQVAQDAGQNASTAQAAAHAPLAVAAAPTTGATNEEAQAGTAGAEGASVAPASAAGIGGAGSPTGIAGVSTGAASGTAANLPGHVALPESEQSGNVTGFTGTTVTPPIEQQQAIAAPQITPPAPALPVTPAAPIANDQQAESAGSPTTTQGQQNGNKAEVAKPAAQGRPAQPAAGAGKGVAPTDLPDVSKRTDKQLAYLSTNGQPGWREAATAEIARRSGGKMAEIEELGGKVAEKWRKSGGKVAEAPTLQYHQQPTPGGAPIEQQSAPMPVGEYGKAKAPTVTSQSPANTDVFLSSRTDDEIGDMSNHTNPKIRELGDAETARRSAMLPKSVSGTSANNGPATAQNSLQVQPPNSGSDTPKSGSADTNESGQEDDWLAALFEKAGVDIPSQEAQQQPADEFSEQDVQGIKKAIEAVIKQSESSRSEWAAKVYKKNRTQVELHGDGPSNRESLSIGGINEKRREKAIAQIDADIRGLKSFLRQLDDNQSKAIGAVRSAVKESESQVFIENWSGLRDNKGNKVVLSADDRAQMNIANEIFGDRYYTRTPATAAVLSAYRSAMQGVVATETDLDAPQAPLSSADAPQADFPIPAFIGAAVTNTEKSVDQIRKAISGVTSGVDGEKEYVEFDYAGDDGHNIAPGHYKIKVTGDAAKWLYRNGYLLGNDADIDAGVSAKLLIQNGGSGLVKNNPKTTSGSGSKPEGSVNLDSVVPNSNGLQPRFDGKTYRQAVEEIVDQYGRLSYLDEGVMYYPSGAPGKSYGYELPAFAAEYYEKYRENPVKSAPQTQADQRKADLEKRKAELLAKRKQSDTPPNMRRDDLVGAILRVTGGDGIHSSMALDTTGDTANRQPKLRGLFTNKGTADLGDVATLLRNEEGYDVRDGKHLAELIRQQAAGDRVTSMESSVAEADSTKEEQYRDSIRKQAKELGLKTAFVKFSDLENRVNEVIEKRRKKLESAMDQRSQDIFDSEMEKLRGVDPDDVDAMLLDLHQNGYSGREFQDEAVKRIRAMSDDVAYTEEANRKLQEAADAERDSEEPQIGQHDEGTDQESGSRPDSGRSTEAQPGEGFALSGQSNSEAAKDEADRVATEKDRASADAKAKAEDKAAADRKAIKQASEKAADTFVLGGNALDNLTGQTSIFDGPAAPPKVETNPDDTPAWHTILPDEGLEITDDQRKPMGYERVGHAIAADAYAAITRDQLLAGGAMSAYYRPAADGRNGIVRLLHDDQTPGKPWALLNSEAIRVGMASEEQVIAKLKNWLRSAPVVGDISAPQVAEKKPDKIAPVAESKPAKPSTGRYVAPNQNPANTEDAGAELTYNRRNRLDRGLKWEDIANKDEALRVKEATKAKVYPRPDYKAMIGEGMAPQLAHIVKQVYDSLAASPRTRRSAAPSDDDIKNYIAGVNRVMDAVIEWANDSDRGGKWLAATVTNSLGRYASALDMMANAVNGEDSKSLLSKAFPDGYEPVKNELVAIGGNKVYGALQPGSQELNDSVKAIKDGWPESQESWQRQGITVINGNDVKAETSGADYGGEKKEVVVRFTIPNGTLSRTLKRVTVDGTRDPDSPEVRKVIDDGLAEFSGRFVLLNKSKTVVSTHATEDEAKAAARALVSREGRKSTVSDKGISVTAAERIGEAKRLPGEDISSDKLRETFKFKGVNFGNWMKGDANEKERQLHLNHAYDSFMDLADVLGVPPEAMSLNGMLGVAIGAQGSGGFAAAHFVPGVNEINLTRESGAGSLAHEWGHALDHYFARQAGLTRAPSPFLTSVLKTAEGSEIRQEILDKFKAIVQAMHKRPITQEEVESQRQEKIASAMRNLDGWMKSIVRGDLMDDAEVAKAIERIKSGDLGDGFVAAGRSSAVKPAIAEFGKIIKEKTGRVLQRTDLSAINSWATNLQYLQGQESGNAEHVPQQMVETQYSKDATSLDKEKGGKPYWSTTLEMFARAFDAFVSDTLEAKAAKNTYLSHAGRDGKTVPTGVERTAINAAIKGLVDTVETKAGEDGNVVLYNVATDTLATPADKAIYGMVAEGKTAAELLEFIGKASRRPFNRYLANALKNLGVLPTIKLDSMSGWNINDRKMAAKYAAAYNPKTDTIALFTAREAERHALHELTHAATLKAIAAGGPASVQMRGLFLYLQRNGSLAGQYGMSNLDEFVAEAFSNPKFQAALKAIPAPKGSTLKNAWQWFVRAVRTALGLKSAAMETALDRAMTDGAKLMRENARLNEAAQGDSRYSRATIPDTITINGVDRPTTNSNGKPIAQDEDGVRRFWEWFGSSAVVDEQGRPRVVYHGTAADFSVFKQSDVGIHFGNLEQAQSRISRNGDGSNIMPTYLSIQNPLLLKDATSWADPVHALESGIGHYLSPGLVKEIDGLTAKYRAIPNLRTKGGQDAAKQLAGSITVKMRAELKAKGYDGIIYANTHDGETMSERMRAEDSWIAFDPEQAKSATGNIGEFSPTNQDIRYNVATDTTTINGVDRPKTSIIQKPRTKEFRDWFDGSKVTKPVYHATQSDFNSFDTSLSDLGAHFGNLAQANKIATGMRLGNREGTQIMPVWLSIKNPIRLKDVGSFHADGISVQLERKGILPKGYGKRIEREIEGDWKLRKKYDPIVIAAIKDAGYDGVVYSNTQEGAGDSYIAFEATQIKSATGNTGEFSLTNPDIRYNIASDWYDGPSGAPVRNAWQAAKAKAAAILAPKTLDKIIYELQDKFIDLKNLREHIRKIGGTITDMNDAYLGEELYHKRLAYRTERFQKDELLPLLEEAKAKGISKDALESFLHARHAPEANAAMAKRNPNQAEIDAGMMRSGAVVKALETQLQRSTARNSATAAISKALNAARGELAGWKSAQAFRGAEEERTSLSGMSDADAAALMGGLAPDRRAALDSLAYRIDEINQGTINLLESYGLMSKESLAEWRKAYKHYVPLHRDEAHPDSFSHPIGQGFSTKGDAAKRRTGSNQKVTNILGHIAMQREAALTRGEKNLVMRKLYLMARQNPLPDVWKIGPVPMIDTIDKGTGFVMAIPDPLHKTRPNVLVLRIAGKDVSITFNEHNPEALRMAHALKNLDVDDLHYMIPVVGKMTRWFASINTQYNPIFGVVNLLRDTQEAAINLSSTELAGKQGEILKDQMSILKAVLKNKGRMPTTGPWAALFDEFNAIGGSTGFRDLFLDAEARSKALQDTINSLDQGNVGKAWDAVAGWLSDYNEAMENSTRLAAYKAGIDSGMSKERAASLAKNLTVNFNRKGRQTRELGALYAFFNAAVQGTARMAQTLTGPSGRKIMAGGVMLGAMNAMIAIAAMGGGNGDDDEWEKIPEFVKENSFIIPIGKSDYISIPMPLGFKLFPNIGRLAAEMAWYKDKTAGKQLASLFTVLADALNPLGGSSPPMQIIAPTVLDPFVALAQNRDWTGKPIYIENRNSLDPSPGMIRSKESATPWAKWFAGVVNGATGGTEYTPGGWSPTPDQIDFVIGQLTGGVGREAGKIASTVAAPLTGEELPPHKIPLLGRFYGSTEGQAGQSEKFYENITLANEAENEIKGRAKAGLSAVEYIKEHPGANVLAARGNVAERQVAALRKMRRAVVARDLPGSTEKVLALNERIALVMTRFNREAERLSQ